MPIVKVKRHVFDKYHLSIFFCGLVEGESGQFCVFTLFCCAFLNVLSCSFSGVRSRSRIHVHGRQKGMEKCEFSSKNRHVEDSCSPFLFLFLFILFWGQHEILKCIILKIKKKKRKGKKMYVAQQRIYLTKKKGVFLVFCQTNGCFHCFEFRGLTS